MMAYEILFLLNSSNEVIRLDILCGASIDMGSSVQANTAIYLGCERSMRKLAG